MKTIEIKISEEQYQLFQTLVKNHATVNIKEETFHGFGLNLNCTEIGISWLELELYDTYNLGHVEWSIK